MKVSFYSRIALMEAAYRDCLRVNGDVRRDLLTGLFWIADTMEEDLREENPDTLRYVLSNIEAVKDIASRSFKDVGHYVGTEPFAEACARLMASLPAE